MNIMVGGGPYELYNEATKQRARLEVSDIFSYRGAAIIYGTKMRAGLWVPSTIGRKETPEGPACFPLFLNEPGQQVVRLVDLLRSLPLLFVLPDKSRLPILSLEDSHKVLGGRRGHRDDMIARAQKLIDVYSEWRGTGLLPEWFRLKKDLVKSRN